MTPRTPLIDKWTSYQQRLPAINRSGASAVAETSGVSGRMLECAPGGIRRADSRIAIANHMAISAVADVYRRIIP